MRNQTGFKVYKYIMRIAVLNAYANYYTVWVQVNVVNFSKKTIFVTLCLLPEMTKPFQKGSILKYLEEQIPLRADHHLTHFILETPKGVLAKSADPDQMPHSVASDLGLHYFASCSAIFQ